MKRPGPVFAISQAVEQAATLGSDHAGCAHAMIRLVLEAGRARWRCEECGTPFAPASTPVAAVDAEPSPEYLSVRELAERIPYSEGTIRNFMSRGVLRLGVHFTKPNGRPVFHWPAIREWMRSEAS